VGNIPKGKILIGERIHLYTFFRLGEEGNGFCVKGGADLLEERRRLYSFSLQEDDYLTISLP